MIKNYIFDLYGTLLQIHTNEEKDEVWNCMHSYYEKDPNQLKTLYKRTCQEEFERLKIIRNSEYPEIDIVRVFERMHPVFQYTPDQIAYAFRKVSREILEPYPDTISTLTKLKEKGKKIYLLSNAQAVFTMDELDLTGLTSLFDGICISSVFGIKKPDVRFMEHLLDTYHLKIEDSIMIGNDFNADIATADALGMQAVHINTDHFSKDYISRQKYACRKIQKLEELLCLNG